MSSQKGDLSPGKLLIRQIEDIFQRELHLHKHEKPDKAQLEQEIASIVVCLKGRTGRGDIFEVTKGSLLQFM